jgi:hypothetical protein
MSNCPDVQKEFDKVYITASEIIETLRISRAAFMYARVSGRMPEAPIVVNKGRLLIWLRDEITPHIAAWKQEIESRKSHN